MEHDDDPEFKGEPDLEPYDPYEDLREEARMEEAERKAEYEVHVLKETIRWYP